MVYSFQAIKPWVHPVEEAFQGALARLPLMGRRRKELADIKDEFEIRRAVVSLIPVTEMRRMLAPANINGADRNYDLYTENFPDWFFRSKIHGPIPDTIRNGQEWWERDDAFNGGRGLIGHRRWMFFSNQAGPVELAHFSSPQIKVAIGDLKSGEPGMQLIRIFPGAENMHVLTSRGLQSQYFYLNGDQFTGKSPGQPDVPAFPLVAQIFSELPLPVQPTR